MHFPLSHQRPVSWQPARHHPYHDPTLVAAMDGVTADEDGGGPSPSPRRFHTADHVCIDGHDYVVIFGGGVDDVFYNDVHLFDVERQCWIPVVDPYHDHNLTDDNNINNNSHPDIEMNSHSAPFPRRGHSSCILRPASIIPSSSSSLSSSSNPINSNFSSPSTSKFHYNHHYYPSSSSSSSIRPAFSDSLIIFGGWTGNQYLCDVWQLTFHRASSSSSSSSSFGNEYGNPFSSIPTIHINWSCLWSNNSPYPIPRTGASAVIDHQGSSRHNSPRLIIFGGSTTDKVKLCDTLVFSLTSRQWHGVHPIDGTLISPPTSITDAATPSALLAYSSLPYHIEFQSNNNNNNNNNNNSNDGSNNNFNDLHFINSSKSSFMIPEPRFFHGSSIQGREMVIVSGKGNGHQEYHPDVWCLHLDRYIWRKMIFADLSPQPHPRDKFHCVSLNDDLVLLFGGWNDSQEDLNDTWLLSMSTCMWQKLHYNENNTQPNRRSAHGLCYIPSLHKVLLFGGWDAEFKDLDDMWILPIHEKLSSFYVDIKSLLRI